MSKLDTTKRKAKRVGIGIVGGMVFIVGVIAIPYPGPGWLIVFAGLAILSTEFDWAKRALDYGKGKYDAWQQWLKRQSVWIRALFFILTSLVVILTIWLLNGYGYISDLFHLGWDWVRSPLPFF